MPKSIKGFSLLEVMITAALVGISSFAVLSLNVHFLAGASDMSAQARAVSLRDEITTVLSDPNLCFVGLDKSVPFSAATANKSSVTNGLPLKVTLQDGTVIDGRNPGLLKNYNLQLVGLTFETNGNAIALPGVNDPLDPAGNKVYAGDVYLNVQKANNMGSSGTIPPQLITSLLITVNNGTSQIVRCYNPDPCSGIQGLNDPTRTPACNICGSAGAVWVGNTPITGEGGSPVCLPKCGAGQFLVANGSGGAVCQTP